MVKRCALLLFLQDLLDYDVDSDDEWEEPGESLSHSEVRHKLLQQLGQPVGLSPLMFKSQLKFHVLEEVS